MLFPHKLGMFDELVLDVGSNFSLEMKALTEFHVAEGTKAKTFAGFVNTKDSVCS